MRFGLLVLLVLFVVGLFGSLASARVYDVAYVPFGDGFVFYESDAGLFQVSSGNGVVASVVKSGDVFRLYVMRSGGGWSKSFDGRVLAFVHPTLDRVLVVYGDILTVSEGFVRFMVYSLDGSLVSEGTFSSLVSSSGGERYLAFGSWGFAIVVENVSVSPRMLEVVIAGDVVRKVGGFPSGEAWLGSCGGGIGLVVEGGEGLSVYRIDPDTGIVMSIGSVDYSGDIDDFGLTGDCGLAFVSRHDGRVVLHLYESGSGLTNVTVPSSNVSSVWLVPGYQVVGVIGKEYGGVYTVAMVNTSSGEVTGRYNITPPPGGKITGVESYGWFAGRLVLGVEFMNQNLEYRGMLVMVPEGGEAFVRELPRAPLVYISDSVHVYVPSGMMLTIAPNGIVEEALAVGFLGARAFAISGDDVFIAGMFTTGLGATYVSAGLHLVETTMERVVETDSLMVMVGGNEETKRTWSFTLSGTKVNVTAECSTGIVAKYVWQDGDWTLKGLRLGKYIVLNIMINSLDPNVVSKLTLNFHNPYSTIHIGDDMGPQVWDADRRTIYLNNMDTNMGTAVFLETSTDPEIGDLPAILWKVRSSPLCPLSDVVLGVESGGSGAQPSPSPSPGGTGTALPGGTTSWSDGKDTGTVAAGEGSGGLLLLIVALVIVVAGALFFVGRR